MKFDAEKKYNFKIGHNIKLGRSFYKIIGIDKLHHVQATGSVATVSTSTVDFDTYLRPIDGYAYFIEWIGIDGALEFQLQFPSGIPHWSVRGQAIRFNRFQARYLDPMYAPFMVTAPNYPSFNFYNPDGAARNADMYFYGWRWRIEHLGSTPPAGEYWTELTDYAAGGIGQG